MPVILPTSKAGDRAKTGYDLPVICAMKQATAARMKGIPNAQDGFPMEFSAGPFPDADFDPRAFRQGGLGDFPRSALDPLY